MNSIFKKNLAVCLKLISDNLVVPEKPEIFDNRTYNERER
jgi:hypothetical protein